MLDEMPPEEREHDLEKSSHRNAALVTRHIDDVSTSGKTSYFVVWSMAFPSSTDPSSSILGAKNRADSRSSQ